MKSLVAVVFRCYDIKHQILDQLQALHLQIQRFIISQIQLRDKSRDEFLQLNDHPVGLCDKCVVVLGIHEGKPSLSSACVTWALVDPAIFFETNQQRRVFLQLPADVALVVYSEVGEDFVENVFPVFNGVELEDLKHDLVSDH